MKIFLGFFDGIGFQWDGGVFYGLKPLARNNALGRTQASWHGTKPWERRAWNARTRDERGGKGWV